MHLAQESTKFKVLEYFAVYVDDLCIAAESPRAIIDIFKSKYNLKVKGDGKLSYHLGADYLKTQMELLLANLRSTLIS